MSESKPHSPRRTTNPPTVRIQNRYPATQWEMFEAICFTEAGINGREALRQIVGQTVACGHYPFSRAWNKPEHEPTVSDQTPTGQPPTATTMEDTTR